MVCRAAPVVGANLGNAVASKLLNFVSVDRRLPEKRDVAERRSDFGEIYRDFARDGAGEQGGDVRSAASRIVRPTARCKTTFPTG